MQTAKYEDLVHSWHMTKTHINCIHTFLCDIESIQFKKHKDLSQHVMGESVFVSKKYKKYFMEMLQY